MARYAIGDVQGCYKSLICLLDQISFDQNHDELWFAGDLVNRGPDSLDCLRLIKSFGESVGRPAKVVLGNHDLHLLATYYLKRQAKKKDTFEEIFAAHDCHELMTWLRHQPLMVWDKENNIAMSHAGFPHLWTTQQAFRYSQEVSNELYRGDYETFFDLMYGNEPSLWADHLSGMMRLRAITNYFTRMRFVTTNGELEFSVKETLDNAPDDYVPWFSLPRPDDTTLIFGHWAALSGHTGLEGPIKDRFQALDTGCVWGGSLTAMNIDTKERFACDC
jgi:bis(5'-nucleosyl)-tetraphosphatase (symmetrical)